MAQPLTVEQIWQKYDADEQRLTFPVSTRMVELAKLRPGMNVLDLATGRGEPAIAAARRILPTGRLLCIDIAPTMLDMARKRADSERLTNMEFLAVDAQVLTGVPSNYFDCVLARWGLMYMADPIAALMAARRASKPGARLVAAMWAAREQVDYFNLPRQVLAKYKAVPPAPAGTPDTFRYSAPEVIAADFHEAGWEIELMEDRYVPVMEAHNAEELIQWCRCFGLNRLLQDEPVDVQAAWESDMIGVWQDLRDEQGIVRLGGTTRIVVANSQTT